MEKLSIPGQVPHATSSLSRTEHPSVSELFVTVRPKKVREIRDQTKGAEGQQAQSQLQRKLVTVKGAPIILSQRTKKF